MRGLKAPRPQDAICMNGWKLAVEVCNGIGVCPSPADAPFVDSQDDELFVYVSNVPPPYTVYVPLRVSVCKYDERCEL